MIRIQSATARRLLLAMGAVACVLANGPAQNAGLLTWEKPIAPGVVFREVLDSENHRSLFALRISLANGAVRPFCSLSGGKVYEPGSATGRAPLSQMVAAESAVAGVNGDFFSMSSGPSGEPLGLAVRDGRILSTPSRRVAFGWGPGGAFMAVASFQGAIQVGSQKISIDGINRQCPLNQLTLNTPDAGSALSAGPATMLRIKMPNATWQPSTAARGTVVQATDGISTPVAADEAVLVARGAKAALLKALPQGAECEITLQTSGFDWQKVDSVIGGGPALVRDGKIATDAAAEGFKPDFSETKHPRTAIGCTADGDLWLVAVDGTQETGDGMSLAELALQMKRLGCTQAMNLDGGGSTTMNVRGITVNRPSDHSERPIADGVLLLGPRAPTTGKVQLFAPTEIGATPEQARVLDNGTLIPNIEVIWGAQGACRVDGGGWVSAVGDGSGSLSAYARGHVLTTTVTCSHAATRPPR